VPLTVHTTLLRDAEELTCCYKTELADADANAATDIKKIADQWKAGGYKVVVTGISDKTGKKADRTKVAQARAKAVHDELVKDGVTDGDITDEIKIDGKKPSVTVKMLPSI
jgi:outer membrane protein OmpA-like peptidoglycan-associated protein